MLFDEIYTFIRYAKHPPEFRLAARLSLERLLPVLEPGTPLAFPLLPCSLP